MLFGLLVCRLQLELSAAGATHVLQDQGCQSSTQGLDTSSAVVSTSYQGLETFQPQWLLLSESNAWRKRVLVMQRFVHAVRVIIFRNRAQARLRKLRALAGEQPLLS